MMPGQPDMASLLKQAQQMLAAQEELASTTVTGTSGGGLVTATVNGSGELQGLVIDPQVIDPDDAETLADLVIAAVHNATSTAQKLQMDKMGPLAGGLGGLGLPGT
ncbi:MAG: YbaB/EbfC family nucleoid-associated protein [Actinomycetota bacterium]|nr:YbaB/EbfC family nucleoid-associated protein [Actinomycetota bacterium]